MIESTRASVGECTESSLIAGASVEHLQENDWVITYLDCGNINVGIIIAVHSGSCGTRIVLVNVHGEFLGRVVRAAELEVEHLILYFKGSAVSILRHFGLPVLVALILRVLFFLSQVALHVFRH